MLGVGIAAHNFHLTANANSRRIPLLGLKRCTVNLLQLSVINVHTESTLDSLKVWPMPVCGDLDAPLDAVCAVLYEVHCPIRSTPADEIGDDQLCVSVNSDPSVNVTPSDFFLRGCHVSRLCADICPYFVTLETADAHIADVLIMVSHARCTEIDKQLRHGVASNSSHARRGTEAVSLNKGGHNPDTLIIAQRVHTEQLCLSKQMESSSILFIFICGSEMKLIRFILTLWESRHLMARTSQTFS